MTAAELKVLRAVAAAHVDAEVAELLHAGHRDWVLFSQDVVTRVQLMEYGGSGYARLTRDLPPLFAEHGVDGAEPRRLMSENPARWLTWR